MVNDLALAANTARRLSRFVEQGGGLFMAAGPRASWPQDIDVLPGTLGVNVDRKTGEAARVGYIEFGHPVFEAFRAPAAETSRRRVCTGIATRPPPKARRSWRDSMLARRP